MKPVGTCIIKREFKATKIWPSSDTGFQEMARLFGLQKDVKSTNLEEEYKKALAGKPAIVMDKSVDGTSYLVLGKSDKVGDFLWCIEVEDTIGFLPIYFNRGELFYGSTGDSSKDFINDLKLNMSKFKSLIPGLAEMDQKSFNEILEKLIGVIK